MCAGTASADDELNPAGPDPWAAGRGGDAGRSGRRMPGRPVSRSDEPEDEGVAEGLPLLGLDRCNQDHDDLVEGDEEEDEDAHQEEDEEATQEVVDEDVDLEVQGLPPLLVNVGMGLPLQ